MFKKLLKLLRLILVGVVWTSAFVLAARLLMIYLWHFDILYKKQWTVLAGFWNNNGVIAGFADYMFFVTLVVLFIVWIWGWRYFYKANYLKLLMSPIAYIANYKLKKYENIDNHIIIKNISVGEKLSVEDFIQNRIKQEKNNPTKEADLLRRNISEKIIQRKE